MPISQALYTGVTGLSVMSDGMSVVANNIANANAKGFKKDRAEFEDMLSSDLSTGGGGGQVGRGARMRAVRTIHTQGGIAVTDNLTDMAIQGQGFFVLNNPNTEVQESAGKFYTRVGSFVFDKDGYLSDPSGGHVMGFMAGKTGALSSKLQDVRIETNSIPPKKTDVVTMDVNLDARMKPVPGEFDIKNAELTSNFNNTINVFDSHGRSHPMTVYYKRMEAEEGQGPSWKWFATVDSKEVTNPDPESEAALVSSGTVKFSSKGLLEVEEMDESEGVNFIDGAEPGQIVKLDFGKNIGEEKGNGLNASRSISSKSVTNYHAQDGYEAGNIKTLKIELDGSIRGIYTNGVQRQLGAVALATFENQDGLLKAGRNLFYGTLDSGPPKIGLAQSGTRGAVYASSLEESNVDLAQEFVNMIMTQRGFQANSRSITTTDSMIEEVVNLKR
ncbi:MAG: flagellar hook protein FlgE [Proteobacteria bacterium]|nr:flagellar hook protein FlgE [Pseudomonadota bacterium]